MDPLTPRSPLDEAIAPPIAGVEARFSLRRGSFELDVDLEVPGDGVTAIFGASGSGKTTLLRAIAGLAIDPGGYLRVGDEVWQQAERVRPPHRRSIGYVFQEPSLFPHRSVRGNLDYPLRRRPLRERSLQVRTAGARSVSFSAAVDLLGLEPLLDRSPDSLSGGERQRVAIGRALLTSPRLLLMDEPLAALDEGAKGEILPFLERVIADLEIPVLYVSHSLDEVARFADHLVLLDSGRVSATGSIEEMLTRLDLPLARGHGAKAVLTARVLEHDDRFGLMTLGFGGGQLVVARRELEPGEEVRVRILARDVSLTLERQTDTSILNLLPVEVEEIVDDGAAQVLLRLSARGTPLLARVTRRSAVHLDLRPGRSAWAQIKAVALLR